MEIYGDSKALQKNPRYIVNLSEDRNYRVFRVEFTNSNFSEQDGASEVLNSLAQSVGFAVKCSGIAVTHSPTL